MQIIINAGGTGTRLWPYSTNSKPKQFVPLIDSESFLTKTYNRLISSFGASQIWVNTNVKFKSLVEDNLPEDFNQKHILTEPEKRDNFAAIISHAALVAGSVGVEETLVFLHADHLITQKDWAQFNQALQIVSTSLENNEFEIVTAGVKPQFANTQLGYIQISPENKENCYSKVVKVDSFKEKPDLETANSFVESGNYLWNLGYFSFTYKNLLKNLQVLYPEVVEIVEKFRNSGVIDGENYSKLPKIAFDYAIAEKTTSLGVIGIDTDWEDIGNWEIAAKYIPELSKNKSQVELVGSGNKVKLLDKNRKVAFVGVSNLLLVESEEGILVIDSSKSSEVKKAAEYFEGL
jgi:mannose-1-phosphate guanylyltransferase